MDSNLDHHQKFGRRAYCRELVLLVGRWWHRGAVKQLVVQHLLLHVHRAIAIAIGVALALWGRAGVLLAIAIAVA